MRDASLRLTTSVCPLSMGKVARYLGQGERKGCR